MKKSLSLWFLIGFTFVSVLGTILHFLYEWTDCISLAPFSAVNESTWEHMKILFFPLLLFAIIQAQFFKKEYKNFWKTKLWGILLGSLLIPVLFYTFNGAFGKTPDWLNILFFFIAAASAFLLEWLLFAKNAKNFLPTPIPILLLCILAFFFLLFTFYPPTLPLFQDPLTLKYGIF